LVMSWGVKCVARYSSTPTSKVLGKLIVSQLVIFIAFYGTPKFEGSALTSRDVMSWMRVLPDFFGGLFQSSSSFLDCLVLKMKALAVFEALAASRSKHGVTSQKTGIF